MNEYVAAALIGVVLTIPYFILGIGVAKMIAKIHNEQVRLVHVCLWPLVALVFAAADDVA